MIAKLLFLIGTLFIQEFVLLNALLLSVHNGAYAPWLIFALFMIASAIDIGIGFYVGTYLRKKTSQTKFGKYIQKQSERFSFAKGSPKRWLTMLILGNVSFCYINAAVAGYLELPFWESQAYNFFGNIVSYALMWYLVGSVSDLFGNSYSSAVVVVVLSLAILFVMRKMRIKKV
jgi:membrane protein DedA with SNARE-associated domain